jgi:hypothetical protein
MDENTVKEQEVQDPKEGVNIQITIGDDGGTPQKIMEKGRKKLLIKQDSMHSGNTTSNHD